MPGYTHVRRVSASGHLHLASTIAPPPTTAGGEVRPRRATAMRGYAADVLAHYRPGRSANGMDRIPAAPQDA